MAQCRTGSARRNTHEGAAPQIRTFPRRETPKRLHVRPCLRIALRRYQKCILLPPDMMRLLLEVSHSICSRERYPFPLQSAVTILNNDECRLEARGVLSRPDSSRPPDSRTARYNYHTKPSSYQEGTGRA